jgi:hypothetical protein
MSWALSVAALLLLPLLRLGMPLLARFGSWMFWQQLLTLQLS